MVSCFPLCAAGACHAGCLDSFMFTTSRSILFELYKMFCFQTVFAEDDGNLNSMTVFSVLSHPRVYAMIFGMTT